MVQVIGGKAGGKEPSRQGSGTEPGKIDEGIKSAEQFLQEKIAELKV